MQVLNKASGKIEKAWGKQKIKDCRYRLMKYTISENCDHGLLLHNVITGELVLLDENEKSLLDNLPCKADEKYFELIEKHFLVPIDFDERKIVGQLRQLLTLLEKKGNITGYTILPTTYCNARCFYCYECDFKHVHMTEEIAHDAVQYMIKHSGGEKISIGWFGGEPLVGVKIISQISRELTENGVEFSSSMISNGALFNEKLVDEAKKLWNLKSVQITIDGTEKIYNEVKDYVSMKGSPYLTVLNNIRMLSKAGIKVSIRINLGFHNVDDTKKLIEELCERFSDCENVSMYVHELYENEGAEPTKYTDEQRDYITNKVNDFNRFVLEHGKYFEKRGLPKLKNSYCMADNDGAVIINPDGVLTKCEHCSSVDGFGTIYSDEYDKANLAQFKKYRDIVDCYDCPLYPKCCILDKCLQFTACSKPKRENQIELVRKNMLYIWTKEN